MAPSSRHSACLRPAGALHACSQACCHVQCRQTMLWTCNNNSADLLLAALDGAVVQPASWGATKSCWQPACTLQPTHCPMRRQANKQGCRVGAVCMHAAAGDLTSFGTCHMPHHATDAAGAFG
jgi:hypothetical protein